MKKTQILLTLLTATALVFATEARANLLTGSLWEAPASGLIDNDLDLIPATLPGSTPDVTFSVDTSSGNLDFDSRGADRMGADDLDYTIGSWLGTGGASITSGNGESGNTINDCLIQILGQVSVTTGEAFSSAHDDGLILTIDGQNVIYAPGPTAPDVTDGMWTGASGTYDFELLYAEVDGAPAVLDINGLLQNATSSVPEPSTIAAGALLLLPFGVSTVRMLRKSRKA